MKAMLFTKAFQAEVLDVPAPVIGADEVLVRMHDVGICHSDYELYAGKYIIPVKFPVRPGHEWSGVVMEAGRDVTALKAGDRVVGECVIERRDRIDHFGFSIDGAYAQYFKARPEWLHRLPDGLSFRAAALVEPFTCGYYALAVNGGTDASETIVVSGGGNIGLCTAAAARAMGARVILVDPLPMRRAAAGRLGVDEVVDPSAEDAAARVRDLTGGRGADFAVEASGHDASLASVFEYVRVGGRVSMMGISIGRKVALEIGRIQGKALAVRGTIGSPGVWPAALRFLDRTGLDLSPIQTHFFPLAEGVGAFEFGKNPAGCIKVTLTNED